jgi:hypothetical protein
MTDEFDQMAKELNNALDIEQNANHAQRLFTILNLRAQALREQETLLELERVTRQRDRAESRVMRLLAGHARFIESIYSRASAIRDVTEEFQAEIGERATDSLLDVFDLALAKMREQRDSGERHGLDDVAEEFDVSREATEDQDAVPLLERVQKMVTDPETSSVLNIGLGSDQDPSQVAPTQPVWTEEEMRQFRKARENGTDTSDHDAAERQPVPFSEPEGVTLASDTRDWLASMAEGGARDDL